LLACVLMYIYIRTNASTFWLKHQKRRPGFFGLWTAAVRSARCSGANLARGDACVFLRPGGGANHHPGKLLIEKASPTRPPEEELQPPFPDRRPLALAPSVDQACRAYRSARKIPKSERLRKISSERGCRNAKQNWAGEVESAASKYGRFRESFQSQKGHTLRP
jgi:hypothetical protein